ncbi:MAG: TolC family protein [Magnetococcales bacterium]|nr:TolC family protein [Magnetococcales bacterium]
MPNHRKAHNRCTAMLVLVALVVSGCSVIPNPITLKEKIALMNADHNSLFEEQEQITRPLTIYDAMARSIKYNLNHRFKIMEEALSLQQLDISKMSMLPNLAMSAGYSDRSSDAAYLGAGALSASTSSDRVSKTGNLTMSWNILDFGVSYFQAQQDADRVLIAAQRRRKVIHNLMRDVRFAFWKAVSAQYLSSKIGPMIKDTNEALTMARKAEQEGLPSPTEALRYQRLLIETLRQLRALQADFVQARTELANMMNLKPGTSFKLDGFNSARQRIPKINFHIEEMERMALMNLPELREEDYQARIGVAETKKAIARMFPGIEIGIGRNYDSNSYLVNSSWGSLSTKLTWNLLGLINGKNRINLAEAKNELGKTRRLSLSMASLSQVHIAYQNFIAVRKQMMLDENLDRIDQRLYENTSNLQKTDMVGHLERIRSAAQSLTSRVQRDQTYAQLQNSAGLIYMSLGMDPLPETVKDHSVDVLAKSIAITMQQWENKSPFSHLRSLKISDQHDSFSILSSNFGKKRNLNSYISANYIDTNDYPVKTRPKPSFAVKLKKENATSSQKIAKHTKQVTTNSDISLQHKPVFNQKAPQPNNAPKNQSTRNRAFQPVREINRYPSQYTDYYYVRLNPNSTLSPPIVPNNNIIYHPAEPYYRWPDNSYGSQHIYYVWP